MKAEDIENKDEKKWGNVNDFLSKNASQLNIMEEEIDVEVQHQFMTLLEFLIKDKTKFKILTEEAPLLIDELYNDSVSEDKKRKILAVLATMNDVAIYRKIEAFQKEDTPLKKWATVALQQSRMLIQSALLDESTVFVSTGLGGHGTLLRYFCVYIANEGVVMQPFQWDIAQKETELEVSKAKGEIESFEHFEQYIMFTLLLPIDAELKDIFQTIINECNTYGDFLKENIIITNVKKLTPEEIDSIVNPKAPKQNRKINPTSDL